MSRRYWFRLRRFLAQRVLHTSDTPHAIALGAGLATLVAFLPVVGFQTVIAVGLAALFRANKAICVPIVWITNPVTIPFVFGACLRFGQWLSASPTTADEQVVISTLQQQHSTGLLAPAAWSNWLGWLAGLGAELCLGCVVVGSVGGVIAYVLVRRGVTTYRERRRARLLRRNLFRANLRSKNVQRRSEPI